MDPDREFDPFFVTFFLANPPYMLHWSAQYCGVLPKLVEAISLLLLASGGRRGQDLEQGLLDICAAGPLVYETWATPG
jgi:hypothetical protein